METTEFTLAFALLAAGIEGLAGYPQPLYRAVGHPVVWLGRLIAWCDRMLNDAAAVSRRRLGGVATLVSVAGVAALAAWAVQHGALVLLGPLPGLAVTAIAGSSLLAQRSLHDHVARVADGLEAQGLAGGRAAVAMIVGRNPAYLDEAGVARAAIESLAENYSDGVAAPLFWGAVGGLPGMAAYKAVNTLDSMIGHKTPRHLAFGWASARFDDLVNLPASRLAALFLCLAALTTGGASARRALAAVRRDARLHRSPNAGWPEAAMAGALSLRLNGPRTYGETRVEDAWMGEGRSDATPADIRRALALYRRACLLQWLFLALAAAAVRY